MYGCSLARSIEKSIQEVFPLKFGFVIDGRIRRFGNNRKRNQPVHFEMFSLFLSKNV